MTSSVDLASVFANVVILLALMAAIASPRVSQLARLVIAIFAFVCAWLITGALDAMRPPDGAMFVGGAVIVVSIVVVIATLHRWTQASDAGETQLGPRGDDGGGAPRGHWPDSPQPVDGGSAPSWWPEFERHFASYVAERESEDRQPVVLPTKPIRP